MSDALNRAKLVQRKVANDTSVWLKLDLLEELIAEIETLQHRVDALSQQHRAHRAGNVADVVELAKGREKAE